MTTPTASNFLELRHASTTHAIFVLVPERRFFAIDGIGEPDAADFRLALSALQTATDLLVRRLRHDGVAMSTRAAVVECTWRPPELLPPSELPVAFEDRSNWHWRQMIELPVSASEAQALAAIDQARASAGRDVALVRPLVYTEGPAAQLLHIGPRSGEPVTLRKLLDAIAEAGLQPGGPLHTLMLTDPGVAQRGQGRSILRQPVA